MAAEPSKAEGLKQLAKAAEMFKASRPDDPDAEGKFVRAVTTLDTIRSEIAKRREQALGPIRKFTNATVGSFGGGRGQLSPVELAKLAHQVGFRGDDLIKAVAIALRESGGNTGARNLSYETNDDSWGLFQINTAGTDQGHRANANIGYRSRDLLDPLVNAQTAYEMYSNNSGFGPWSTNWPGRDEKLATAEQAVRELGLFKDGGMVNFDTGGTVDLTELQRVAGQSGSRESVLREMERQRNLNKFGGQELVDLVKSGQVGNIEEFKKRLLTIARIKQIAEAYANRQYDSNSPVGAPSRWNQMSPTEKMIMGRNIAIGADKSLALRKMDSMFETRMPESAEEWRVFLEQIGEIPQERKLGSRGFASGGGMIVGGEPHFITKSDGQPVAAITEDGAPEHVGGKGVEITPMLPGRRAAYEQAKASGQVTPGQPAPDAVQQIIEQLPPEIRQKVLQKLILLARQDPEAVRDPAVVEQVVQECIAEYGGGEGAPLPEGGPPAGFATGGFQPMNPAEDKNAISRTTAALPGGYAQRTSGATDGRVFNGLTNNGRPTDPAQQALSQRVLPTPQAVSLRGQLRAQFGGQAPNSFQQIRDAAIARAQATKSQASQHASAQGLANAQGVPFQQQPRDMNGDGIIDARDLQVIEQGGTIKKTLPQQGISVSLAPVKTPTKVDPSMPETTGPSGPDGVGIPQAAPQAQQLIAQSAPAEPAAVPAVVPTANSSLASQLSAAAPTPPASTQGYPTVDAVSAAFGTRNPQYDFDGNGVVNSNDILRAQLGTPDAIARNFSAQRGQEGYNQYQDLDNNGIINSADLLRAQLRAAQPPVYQNTTTPRMATGGVVGIGSGGNRVIGREDAMPAFGYMRGATYNRAARKVPNLPGVEILQGWKHSPRKLKQMGDLGRQLTLSYWQASGADPNSFMEQAQMAVPGSATTGRIFV